MRDIDAPIVKAESTAQASTNMEHRALLRRGRSIGHIAFEKLFCSLQPLVRFDGVEAWRAPQPNHWNENDATLGFDVVALAPFVRELDSAWTYHMDPLPKSYIKALMKMDRVIVIALDVKPTASSFLKRSHFDEYKRRTSWDPSKVRVRHHPYTCRRLDPATWDDFGAHVIWVCYPSDDGKGHYIGKRYEQALSALIGKSAIKEFFDEHLDEELERRA